jgi:hypothetical protein
MENMSLVDGVWLAAETAEGRMAAGCLLLQDGSGSLLTLLGRDYVTPQAYFQIAYAGVRAAIESGARSLRAGSGAYELKRRLGFEVLDNGHLVFLTGSRALARLGAWLASS